MSNVSARSSLSGPDFDGRYLKAIHVWHNRSPGYAFTQIDTAIKSGFTIKSTPEIEGRGFVVILEKRQGNTGTQYDSENNPDWVPIVPDNQTEQDSEDLRENGEEEEDEFSINRVSDLRYGSC